MPFTKDKYFSASQVLQCIESKQWHILFLSQFIWIAVPYLLKLSGEWCSGDVLSSAHGCICVCCRRWLQCNMGGASKHLFCFPHVIILVYCCSILFAYKKPLKNKQNSLCCSLSQTWFFVLREISSKVNYQGIFTLIGCWKPPHRFCLDGASVSPCLCLTDVTDETPEKCCSVSVF